MGSAAIEVLLMVAWVVTVLGVPRARMQPEGVAANIVDLFSTYDSLQRCCYCRDSQFPFLLVLGGFVLAVGHPGCGDAVLLKPSLAPAAACVNTSATSCCRQV